MLCPTCRRPINVNAYGRNPQHTDLRTGGRSICPASGRMPEHSDPPEYDPDDAEAQRYAETCADANTEYDRIEAEEAGRG